MRIDTDDGPYWLELNDKPTEDLIEIAVRRDDYIYVGVVTGQVYRQHNAMDSWSVFHHPGVLS